MPPLAVPGFSKQLTEIGVTSSEIPFTWNPKNLEIKTRTVEKTLEPLVLQVTTLVSSKSPQKKKGKSKKAIVLVAAVERATQNFVEKGELIALEHPEIKHEEHDHVELTDNNLAFLIIIQNNFSIRLKIVDKFTGRET